MAAVDRAPGGRRTVIEGRGVERRGVAAPRNARCESRGKTPQQTRLEAHRPIMAAEIGAVIPSDDEMSITLD